MSLFDFKEEEIFEISVDDKFVISDAVIGDLVNIWKPEEEELISFYNNEVEGLGIETMMGNINNENLFKLLDEHIRHFAIVDNVSENKILIKVKLIEEYIDLLYLEEEYEENDSKESTLRHKNILKRFDNRRRILKENRDLFLPEYEITVKRHQIQLEAFYNKINFLKENFNKSKFNLLNELVLEKIAEIKDEIYWRKEGYESTPERHQVSDDGLLFDVITRELVEKQCKFEEILKTGFQNLVDSQNGKLK